MRHWIARKDRATVFAALLAVVMVSLGALSYALGVGDDVTSIGVILVTLAIAGLLLQRRNSAALPARLEAAAIVTICGATLLVSHGFNLFERVATFVIAHHGWQLDDLLLLSIAGVIGLGMYAVRRWAELRRETAARLAAEAVLRRHAVVFSTTADAVIIFDSTSCITDANAAATAMLGYSGEEFVGQSAMLWQRPDEAAQRVTDVLRSLAAHGKWDGQYTAIRKDGTSCVVDSRVRTIDPLDGGPRQLLAVLRDVSEKRRLETHLLQAQKMEAVGSLGAGIAHEINTPMQYVTDNVQFLGEGAVAMRRILVHAQALADAARTSPSLAPLVAEFDRSAVTEELVYLDAQLPDTITHAAQGCTRVSEIVHALSRFATVGSQEMTLTDLNAGIRDTLTVCRSEWKYVATMSMELDTELPLVSCLPAEVRLVILNLIVNAAQAIGSRLVPSRVLGKITVSTEHSAEWVAIHVTDDGPGIPEAIRSRVFDQFFTTKEPGDGTGQGLSIGHATIVGRHRGTFTFESVEGRGTTFTIRLPRTAAVPLSSAA